MEESSPSSSCSSTAVAASPSRIQRGGRQGSENLATLLPPSTPASPSQGQARGPSRSRWLLLQSCFVVLVLASVVLFSMDAQRVAWVSKLLHRTGPAAPAPAFQAGQPVHSRKAAAGARTPDQDKADAAAFLKDAHELDWNPEEHSSRVGGGIPKILHHIFLDGEQEYSKAVEAAKAVGSGFKREWRDSCLNNHSDWKHMFWDKASALAFLGTHYPWFISTFLDYPKVVLQGDALRPFLLHAFGGLYVDLDVQCFRSSAAWLAPYTLVLQSEYKEGRDIVNSVMASVPGHPFWKAIIGQMIQQIGAYGGQMNSDIILESTGPRLYSAVYHGYIPLSVREQPYPGELQMGQSKIRVYGLGQWFVPCVWDDQVCHKAMAVEVQAGRIPEPLAGHHQYSGSWLSTVPRGVRRH